MKKKKKENGDPRGQKVKEQQGIVLAKTRSGHATAPQPVKDQQDNLTRAR